MYFKNNFKFIAPKGFMGRANERNKKVTFPDFAGYHWPFAYLTIC